MIISHRKVLLKKSMESLRKYRKRVTCFYVIVFLGLFHMSVAYAETYKWPDYTKTLRRSVCKRTNEKSVSVEVNLPESFIKKYEKVPLVFTGYDFDKWDKAYVKVNDQKAYNFFGSYIDEKTTQERINIKTEHLKAGSNTLTFSSGAHKRFYCIIKLHFDIPEWSEEIISLIPQPQYVTFQDDFTDNRNNWEEWDEKSSMAKVQKGTYFLRNKKKRIVIYPRIDFVHIDPNDDFEIETKVKFVSGAKAGFVSVLWGVSASDEDEAHYDNDNYYEFGVRRSGFYWYGKQEDKKWYDIIPETPSQYIQQGNSTNVLSVRKSGNQIQFFINNQYVDEAEFENFFGSYFGFGFGRPIKVEIDYLIIRQPKNPQ